MPIDRDTLDAIARAWVEPMTSIRGRRVHRLLMRDFGRFDRVVRAVAEDGGPALLALADDGAAAICRTDGRGATAEIAAWPRLQGAVVTTSYDLTKDSLPVVGWMLWHASFAQVTGRLTIPTLDLSASQIDDVAQALRVLGRSGDPR